METWRKPRRDVRQFLSRHDRFGLKAAERRSCFCDGEPHRPGRAFGDQTRHFAILLLPSMKHACRESQHLDFFPYSTQTTQIIEYRVDPTCILVHAGLMNVTARPLSRMGRGGLLRSRTKTLRCSSRFSKSTDRRGCCRVNQDVIARISPGERQARDGHRDVRAWTYGGERAHGFARNQSHVIPGKRPERSPLVSRVAAVVLSKALSAAVIPVTVSIAAVMSADVLGWTRM